MERSWVGSHVSWRVGHFHAWELFIGPYTRMCSHVVHIVWTQKQKGTVFGTCCGSYHARVHCLLVAFRLVLSGMNSILPRPLDAFALSSRRFFWHPSSTPVVIGHAVCCSRSERFVEMCAKCRDRGIMGDAPMSVVHKFCSKRNEFSLSKIWGALWEYCVVERD